MKCRYTDYPNCSCGSPAIACVMLRSTANPAGLTSFTATIGLNDKGEVSDGYHTFNELYEHRHVLWLAVCRFWSGYGHLVWRSKRHADGSKYNGWFLLGMHKAPGSQITYHLPLRLWDAADFADELERAPEFDGHTSDDVLERLRALLISNAPK